MGLHFLISCLLLVSSYASVSNVEVSLSLGKISGYVKKSPSGHEFNAFEGIPYAVPPIKHLRFKDPVAVKSWEGTFEAHTPGPACLQNNPNISASEDCLYLNVYTPQQSSMSGAQLDVLVVIHGGGFQTGFSHIQEPDFLMERDDIIVVTINYRLGVLGFLSLGDDLIPGNYGLKDQTVALKWVKDHISAFGGDPLKVTLIGCSAGAGSVHFHVLSPLSKGLFQKGIMMSGSALNPWSIQRNPKAVALKIADAAGCSYDGQDETFLSCMQTKPAELLAEKANLFLEFLVFDSMAIRPVIERPSPTAFIDDDPKVLIESGKVNDVPLLISHTDDDGLFLAAEVLYKDEFVEELETKWNDLAPIVFDYNPSSSNSNAISQAIKEFYFGKHPIRNKPEQLSRLFTERYLSLGIQKSAKLQAQVSRSPVYAYIFSHTGGIRLSDMKNITDKYQGGADHGDDFLYIFSSQMLNKRAGNPSETAMSKKMIDIVMKFIKENPVQGWQTVQSGLPNFTYMNISGLEKEDKFETSTELPSQAFWDSLFVEPSHSTERERIEL